MALFLLDRYPDTVGTLLLATTISHPADTLFASHSQLLIAKKPALPLGKDRFTLQATVYSLAQQATVATAEETCVSYDYAKLTKIDLPEDFRQALEATGANPAA